MNTVQFIQRDYIPKVDLEILNKSYNTLEQGHKEAVKAASDLEVAMANLDLNEAESEWRQQKINEIKQTVADNTIYGNSYAALDNIIMQAGDLASDQGMIGRLQAQKDYKAFRERVENDKTLPQDYKDYYLENNPYHYEDTYDKNGNIIGGTKWSPNSSPIAIVPLSQLVVQGISIAAKESGNGTMTRWIDSNGNITTDPNKAFDGEVYNTTTNKWERLSHEKIWQGINAMIESTPGAKESIKQDYDVAIWKHDKIVKSNNGARVIDDVTDKNGIPLNEKDYLLKRINPALQAASFYNSHSITTYGDSLATYKTAIKAAVKATQNANNDNTLADRYRIDSSNTPITMDYDYAGKLQAQQQNSYNSLVDIYKSVTGENLGGSMQDATSEDWQKLINSLLGVTSPDVIVDMRTQLRRLNEARANYSNIEKQINDSDYKKDLSFVTRMNNGGEFDPYNTNDEKALDIIENGIFKNDAQILMITTTDDNVYNDIINILNGDTVDGYKNLGIKVGVHSNGNKYITLDKDYYQNLMILSKAYNAALKRQSFLTSLWNDTHVNILNSQGKAIPVHNSTTGTTAELNFRNLGRILTDTEDRIKKNISDIVPYQITVSNENLPNKTFAHQLLYYDYATGRIEGADYNRHLTNLDKETQSKLINANYSQIDIFALEGDNNAGTLQRVVNSEDRQNIGAEIVNGIGTKRIAYNAAHNPIYGHGTNMTIYDKADSDGNPIGVPRHYFIPGIINSNAAKAFDNDLSTIAADKIVIGNEVKQTIILSEQYDTPTLGEQKIVCHGRNQFTYKIKNREIPVNRAGAELITKSMEKYHQTKDKFISGAYNSQAELDEDIVSVAEGICEAINQPDLLRGIAVSLENDLTK